MPENTADPLLTRQTLLLRLRDQADQESWGEFADIYTPLLYAYCQKRELRHADIADIVQEVMRSVSLALAKSQYDPARGKFKAWLFTTVRNAISSHFRKQSRRPLTVAETGLLDSMAASPSQAEEADWERDYQRQLLAWGVDQIRPEFAARIWRAFEATALEDLDPGDVAAELGMSKKAVAVAKYRVLKRLREKMCSIDADRWEQEMVKKSHKA